MIFLITLIDNSSNKQNIRCPGYFESFNIARDTILNNELDIHEETYQYVIIEMLDPGLYQPCRRIWYEWLDGKYQLMEKDNIPSWSKKIHGSFVIN